MTPHPPALAALALAVALAPPALAAPPKPVVTGAWSRPTAGAASMGVVYLTVRNPGPADRLTGAASPLARAAELHRSEMAGGMMHMAPEGPLPVPANGELKLAPGGLHLMLVGLKRPLRLGEDGAGDADLRARGRGRRARAGAVASAALNRPPRRPARKRSPAPSS